MARGLDATMPLMGWHTRFASMAALGVTGALFACTGDDEPSSPMDATPGCDGCSDGCGPDPEPHADASHDAPTSPDSPARDASDAAAERSQDATSGEPS